MPVRSLAQLSSVNKRMARMTIPYMGHVATWASQRALLPLLHTLHSEDGDVSLNPLRSALTACRIDGSLGDALIDAVEYDIDRKLGLNPALQLRGRVFHEGWCSTSDVFLSFRKDASRWLQAVTKCLDAPDDLVDVVRTQVAHAGLLWTHLPPPYLGGFVPRHYQQIYGTDYQEQQQLWDHRQNTYAMTTWQHCILDAARSLVAWRPHTVWQPLELLALHKLDPMPQLVHQHEAYRLSLFLHAFHHRVEAHDELDDMPMDMPGLTSLNIDATMGALRTANADVADVLGFVLHWCRRLEHEDGDDEDFAHTLFQVVQHADLSVIEVAALVQFYVDEGESHDITISRLFLAHWSRQTHFPRGFDDASRAAVVDALPQEGVGLASVVGSWIRTLLAPHDAEGMERRDKALIDALVERFVVPLVDPREDDHWWP
jgi:hypothetical protein